MIPPTPKTNNQYCDRSWNVVVWACVLHDIDRYYPCIDYTTFTCGRKSMQYRVISKAYKRSIDPNARTTLFWINVKILNRSTLAVVVYDSARIVIVDLE